MAEKKRGIHVRKIDPLNLLVFDIGRDNEEVILTDTSVIISIANISAIIKFLVFNKILSYKSLEGILEEYYTFFEKEHYDEN